MSSALASSDGARRVPPTAPLAGAQRTLGTQHVVTVVTLVPDSASVGHLLGLHRPSSAC